MRIHQLLAAGLALFAASAYAAEHQVQAMPNNRFQPSQLTIEAGDTVTWTNAGGVHNVDADDGNFRCANGCDGQGGDGSPASNAWSFSLTFDDPGEIKYHCDVHVGVGMVGSITVEPKQDEEPPAMPPNFGHTGSWFNPATDGQGFSIEVVVREGEPSDVVVYWFTFNEAGEMAATANKQGVVDDHRWYIATGELPAQDNVVDLTVFISSGGEFDTEPPPAPSQEAAGTGTLAFSSCTEGVLTYDIELRNQDAQQVSGEIPIQRLTPDVECENLAAQ